MLRECAIVCAIVATSVAVVQPAKAATSYSPPNIVVILTDDQAEGTMDAMPITRSTIRDRGVTLKNGVIPTSTCCPSRTTLLSGQYSRTTRVYRNVGPYGGWGVFNAQGTESHTLAVELDSAGYRTGLFGKYLNGFALADSGYVPPGWDEFRAIFDPSSKPQLAAGAYYNYDLRGTSSSTYGDQPSEYSTDVIAAEAVKFVEATPQAEPLFLYFAPSAPHAPFAAAPRHQETWHKESLGSAATELTKGRPSFLPNTLLREKKLRGALQRQHESLMSVDEAVGDIIKALGPRVQDTLFVYLSDNGLQFGEHGLKHKYVPYSGSTDVPMFLRWDGVIEPNSSYAGLVTNADLAVTMAEAAGVRLTDPDGVSYFSDQRPTAVVLEATANDDHPAYCGLRTRRYLYVQYANAERELYDYAHDPNELVNIANRTKHAGVRKELHQETITTCKPTPPGFAW